MIDSMLSKLEEDTGSKADCLAMGIGDALKRIETEAGAPQADLLWSGTIGEVVKFIEGAEKEAEYY